VFPPGLRTEAFPQLLFSVDSGLTKCLRIADQDVVNRPERDAVSTFRPPKGGTLVLDDLGECDLQFQVKLLRVLQPPPGKGPCLRALYPVGTDEPVSSLRYSCLFAPISGQSFEG
jgi:Sigma-54 interaction domain